MRTLAWVLISDTLEQMGPHAPPYAIRRAMTEAKVRADDRRARFVGVSAYEAAGGSVLRDLFTEDGGGWLEHVGLLDRLVGEKLTGLPTRRASAKAGNGPRSTPTSRTGPATAGSGPSRSSEPRRRPPPSPPCRRNTTASSPRRARTA